MSRVRSGMTGYTIVETMIFLAVSGALFLSAMLLVNGQQRKTEFTTTVREFDSKLQSIISNVANGYYNNPGQITCTVAGGTITINPTPSAQGQNSDCTFIGQYIDLAATNDKFTITSYAGLRRVGSPPREVQNLAEANPTPITATAEEYTFRSGITISMKLISGGQPVRTLAITPTFNQNVGGSLASGSSRSDLYAIDTAAGLNELNPDPGVQICVIDGDQVGVIILNTGSTRITIGDTCP